MKRVISLFLAVFMTVSVISALAVVGASAAPSSFEENFDEYEAGIGAGATKLADRFIVDANSIGEGYVRIDEDKSGNLYLTSHVFTQTYLRDPIIGNYTFSLDVRAMQGGHAAGIFIRAPKNNASYYEADGGDAQNELSTGRSGLMVYCNTDNFQVNVKTFDKKATEHVKDNTLTFALPSGVRFNQENYVNVRFEDYDGEVAIYVAETLMCKIKFSEPTKVYKQLTITDKCFNAASVYGADGSLLAEYTGTLVSAEQSIVGWATRCSHMEIDNLVLTEETPAGGDDPAPQANDLPDYSPATQPTEAFAEHNRLYPWLETSSKNYKYDFSATDIKVYSQDENLATAGLRSGMSFANGRLEGVDGKTFSFGSGIFLGDDYGIVGGTLSFDMKTQSGTLAIGTRLSKKAADPSKLGIWFVFDGSKLSVVEPETKLKVTLDYDADKDAKYTVTDKVDSIVLACDGKTVVTVYYNLGAIHIYDVNGKWLGGTNSSNVNSAGYFTVYGGSFKGYVDNIEFSHSEITDKTECSGDNTVDFSTWVATDDRNRTTPTGDTAGAVNGKQVGLFYFITFTGSDSETPLDNTKLFLDLGIDKLKEYYEAGQQGAYYWAEPYYGYYKNTDTWVYRRHAMMLEAAGVDFIYVDLTNGATYPDALTALFDTWLEMRHEGLNTPDICVFAGNASSSTNASLTSIRGMMYSQENWDKYSELFYVYEGKPLILVGSDQGLDAANNEFLKKFTVKCCWAWQDRDGWWSWIQEYINNPDGTVTYVNGGAGRDEAGNFEALALMIGHHATTNKGRSFADGVFPDTSKEDFGFSLDSGAGTGFASQFEAIKKLDPPMILLCGWNEWTAGINYNSASEQFEYMGGTHVNGYGFIDQFNTEYSRDAEPMKIRDGETAVGFGDNYYYQMTSIIREYKGMNGVTSASGEKSVDITDKSVWGDVGPEYTDYVGDTEYRHSDGYFTGYTYVNNTGRNDFEYAKVSQDANYLYFNVKCVNNIVTDDGKNWMNLFINIDGNAETGWEGYDFVLNRERDGNYVSIESLANGWEGKHIGLAMYYVDGDNMTVRVSKSVIGVDGEITSFLFKWADNSTLTGDVMQFMELGDTAPNDRFAYLYNGKQTNNTQEISYIGKITLRDESQPMYGEDTDVTEKTKAPTNIATEPIAEATTAAPSEEKRGCCGYIGFGIAAVMLIPAVVIKKKYD